MAKKLNCKHFHFLKKKELKQPKKYLKHLFVEQDINWVINFNFLISSILTPKIEKSGFDFGLNFIYIGKMIDIAFILHKVLNNGKDNISTKTDSKYRGANFKSFFDAGLGDDFDEIAKDYCRNFLNELFLFKSHRNWYKEMQDLLLIAFNTSMLDSIIPNLDNHHISRQFLTNLPHILKIIYKYSLIKNEDIKFKNDK